MNRANLLIVCVLTLGLAGMFFWTLSLHNEQSRLLGDAGVGGIVGNGSDHERRIRELEGASGSQALRIEAIQGTVARTTQRLEEVEESIATQRERLESLGAGGAVVAGGDGVSDTVLAETIEDVLEKKAEEERRQRMERMARGMSRFLLAEIETTEEQQDRFVDVIVSYMTKRGEIRERFSGENEDDQLRDQEIQRLDENRDAELGRIFSANDLSTIQERLERGSRWMGGRGRGGPGGGRTGGTNRPR